MPPQRLSRRLARRDNMPAAIVIIIRMFRDLITRVHFRHIWHVMGISIVQRVVRADNRNIVGFRPPQAHKPHRVRRMRMNYVELMLPKIPQCKVKWRDCERVSRKQRQADRGEPIDIRIRILVPSKSGRKYMRRVSTRAQFVDERVYTYRDPIYNRTEAIRKYGNSQSLFGISPEGLHKIYDPGQFESPLVSRGPVMLKPSAVCISPNGSRADSQEPRSLFQIELRVHHAHN